MTLQKELINGVACVTDSAAPGVPVTNLAQDGGDIVANNAERLSNLYGELIGIEHTIPNRIYAAAGRENNVYFVNAIRAAFPGLVEYDVACALGTQQNERWTFTAVDGDVTSGNIRDLAWQLNCYVGTALATYKATTLRIAKSTAGTGVTRKVLVIGDSTGAGWLPELMNLFDGDAMTATLVGQHATTANDSESGSRTSHHEAISGWGWATSSTSLQTQLYESGDALNQCSAWSFAGHLATNTNNGTLYWKLTNANGSNLVVNGGFETLGAGGADVFATWVDQAGTGAALVEDETGTAKDTGSHSLKMTHGTDLWYAPRVTQDCSVTAGEQYRLSMRCRGDGTNAPHFTLFDNTHSTYITGNSNTAVTTGVTGTTYTEFSYDFTAPAGCSSVKIYLVPANVNGAVAYFDEVSLVRLNVRTVNVYKNSDGAGGNLVATGSRQNDGVVTLAAANASGLTGSVTVAYSADDTDLASNTLILNFFVRASVFDFDQYCTDTSTAMASGDWVLIHLGINDVASYGADSTVEAFITNTLAPAVAAIVGTGVGGIRESVSGIRIGIMLPIPPSQDQDAFGNNYANSINQRQYKRNIDILREWMITTYGSMEASGIYLCPVHLGVDPYYSMSFGSAAPANARVATTIARQSNGVHPASAGYWQMADQVYAFLKGQET